MALFISQHRLANINHAFWRKKNEAFYFFHFQILILEINRCYNILNCYLVHKQSHLHKKLSYDGSAFWQTIAYVILLACCVAQIDIQHFYNVLQLQILLERALKKKNQMKLPFSMTPNPDDHICDP